MSYRSLKVNLKKYRPKYIVVEIHTQKMKTCNLIQEYLSLNKYKFLEKIPDSEDYLYVDCFL